ncbi:MAG: DUF2807 domain-containing protein, partial [bacterium]
GVELVPFTGVDASGEVEVEVESGQAFDIVANQKMKEYVTFTVTDGVLRLRCVGAGPGELVSRRVVVRLPNLVAATADNGARLVVRNVVGERFVVVSRSGGKVDVAGRVTVAQCRVSGGGQLFGTQLRTERMSVRLEGDGEVHCSAAQELVVVIMGKGLVWCHGKPGLVTRNISGGGELRFDQE